MTRPLPDPATLPPAMKQYVVFKNQHPDYVLFFRMGDFYEMFFEDAEIAARVLGVTKTSRNKGAPDEIPMAGVPFHSVDGYLRRMIQAGYKVAICEQAEDPATTKGVVRREIVRLMTPGTLTDEPLLDGKADNFLAAIAFNITKRNGYRAALAWAELSTGSLCAMSGSEAEIIDEVARLAPAEVCIPELPSGQPHAIGERVSAAGVKAITARPGWQFTPHAGKETLLRQWQMKSPAGLGFEDDDPAIQACAAIVAYLEETQKAALGHVRAPRRHVPADHLLIDPASYRALEIDRTVRSGGTDGSLLSSIDRTKTSMGARLLRSWLRSPLCEVEHILARQTAVAALVGSPAVVKEIVDVLRDVCDVERVVGRLTVGRASPRDLAGLARTLDTLPALFDLLDRETSIAPELTAIRPFCCEQATFLKAAVMAEPAQHLREGGVIGIAFDAELDRLREIGTNSRQWLANYQSKLAADAGISTLKVSYNKVFGYYIEVTDLHREKIPPEWTRKQTVKNAERYITAELKDFENDALGARDRAVALEQQLFEKIRQTLLPHVSAFQELAEGLARLDVLSALASLAVERRYCRPEINDGKSLLVIDGRHPVLDQQLGGEFVANDTKFAEEDSLSLITGPNMAGKSTYIRQVALIALLAQIGSYVPAKSATIGVVDRLFARIGASDELHAGQSTFMVEMTETANILNNATDRSLVVLDEIGRGTSTLDGLSLAWAIAEHVADTLRCRTLFATHYHELTALAERFKGVKNLNVAVREWEDQVVFLHRIVEGGTDRSYGIHVARLAGVPKAVLERARQLLGELAVQHVGRPRVSRSRRAGDSREVDANQMELFLDPAKELQKALASADLDALAPMAAFDLLRQLKEKYAK